VKGKGQFSVLLDTNKFRRGGKLEMKLQMKNSDGAKESSSRGEVSFFSLHEGWGLKKYKKKNL